MPRMTIREKASQGMARREYSFTVVFEPVSGAARDRNGRQARAVSNPSSSGYQVTVPLLPGLITYGRTLGEAREMARDAIRCHLEGLRKDGEPIPNEKNTRKEKLRIEVVPRTLARATCPASMHHFRWMSAWTPMIFVRGTSMKSEIE